MTENEKLALMELIRRAIEAAFHETPELKEHARTAGQAADTAMRAWIQRMPTTSDR